jgi:hypothetical protein
MSAIAHSSPSQPWSRSLGVSNPSGRSILGEREKASRRNGKHSAITFLNHDSYEGEWLDDMKHGQGIYIWADGSKYVGEYENDLRSGMGTFYEPTGDGNLRILYDGEWRNDAMQGQGDNRFVFENGDTYEGPMLDNMRHGEGTLKFADGSCYDGAFNNGVRQGFGRLTEGSGDVFEGEWYGDKKHGPGTLYALSRGWVSTGVWNTNDPITMEIRQLDAEEIAELSGLEVDVSELPSIPVAGLADPSTVYEKERDVALREVVNYRPSTTSTDTTTQNERRKMP